MDRLESGAIKNLLKQLCDVDVGATSYETPNMLYILGIEEKEVLLAPGDFSQYGPGDFNQKRAR